MQMNRDDFFADGQWLKSASPRRIEVVNPATEAVIGHVPDGDAADVERAVQAARTAFEGWRLTPIERRAALLETLQAGLKRRADELARLITAEVGMPLRMSQRLQVGLPLTTLATTRQLLDHHAFEERIGNSLVVRGPIGVVACITPWNYPLNQAMSKVAPALAAGCTVVLKPSEVAPFSAFLLAEEIAAAGFPPGVFNLVTGQGSTAGEALVAHEQVDMVSFTGSTAAGRRVSALAAETIKRVSLELGGKSASIVLGDADLATAVKTTVNMCLLNAGQTCTALTRLLVPESRYAEAATLAAATAGSFTAGDPLDDKTRLGPLTSALQKQRVLGHIAEAIHSGAELLCGGLEAPAGVERGFYVSPTVFGRVDPRSAIARQEVFGPVLCILTYRDEDEAVAIANDTVYGLAGAVWSASDERAAAVARRLRTGQVDINGGPFNPLAPLGGYKQSGNGRELGRFGLEEFLEIQSLQFRPASSPA